MKTKIAVFDKMDGSAREGSPDEDNEGKLKKILKKDLNSNESFERIVFFNFYKFTKLTWGCAGMGHPN